MGPGVATMGRGQQGAEVRWPQVHQYQKETVAFLSVVCAILAGCLLLYFLDARQINHDKRWADLPWIATSCTVLDVGVAYRGTCRLDTSFIAAPRHDFAECAGPADAEGGKQDREAVRRAWLRTAAGQCATLGDRDYRATKPPAAAGADGEELSDEGLDTTSAEVAGDDFGFSRRLRGDGVAGDVAGSSRRLRDEAPQRDDGNGTNATSAEAAGEDVGVGQRLRDEEGTLALPWRRRLVNGFRPRTQAQLCHSAYLVWAQVRPANAAKLEAPRERCSYRFGASAPSITADWDDAARQLAALKARRHGQQALPCWRLRDGDCVVASSPLEELAAEQREGARTAKTIGFALAGAAALLALAGGYLHCQDNGCCGMAPPGGYHISVPTGDPDDAFVCTVAAPSCGGPLSDRVLGIVRAAAARLGDATPTTSGEVSLRAHHPGSRRVVEVVGMGGHSARAPRNIAADFLMEMSPPCGGL